MAAAHLGAVSTQRLRPIALTAILAAAASSADAAPEHLGAERCGACHEKQYEAWKKSPHARALARLTDKQRRTAQCRSCHTMDPWSQDPALQGVQCESCHGAGRAYAPAFVMRDAMLSELMGLAKVDASTCKSCHRADAPRLRAFDGAAMLERVRHACVGDVEKP